MRFLILYIHPTLSTMFTRYSATTFKTTEYSSA